MKKTLVIFFITFSMIILGYTITATINPYYLLLKDLAGNKMEIFLLIKPGANPHLYSPKISDVKKMNSSDLIIANGLELEPYIKNNNKVFYVSKFIPEMFIIDNNPHIWLNPFFAKYYIIPGITKKLIDIDPENKVYYLNRAKSIINNLDAIIKELYEFLGKFQDSKVLVEHPSFYYFFNEFGIRSIPLESGHGKEVSIKNIIEILKKGENLVAIFGEAQQNTRSLKIISKELQKKYYILDPLGNNAKNYVDIFLNNLKIIKEAFSYAK
ncbi:zinc ABC transporter substrate-binding protein [Thermosipho ferrireducens]|uniref:Zinc ABC transporter substrate-binding protein n=1 Tax=Thermosipho ferrireducens TaxID=2571116 RepID=A0ABX7S6B0_9BACT|nr:metal ABC transporter substrate-binding protein [Thermosipho ferrireducens]QTA38107.1 zinc ABC transporter substrate-binding protein [Thermosipho ferrireducens]